MIRKEFQCIVARSATVSELGDQSAEDFSQAEHARHELHEAREYCWNHSHRWWDVETHGWRTDHDCDDDHGHPR